MLKTERRGGAAAPHGVPPVILDSLEVPMRRSTSRTPSPVTVLVTLAVVACTDRLPTDPEPVIDAPEASDVVEQPLPLFSTSGGDGEREVIFGPVTFVGQDDDDAGLETHVFPTAGYEAPFMIHIQNGNDRGKKKAKSAHISPHKSNHSVSEYL